MSYGRVKHDLRKVAQRGTNESEDAGRRVRLEVRVRRQALFDYRGNSLRGYYEALACVSPASTKHPSTHWGRRGRGARCSLVRGATPTSAMKRALHALARKIK